jgi:hypothetical protein
LDGHVEHIALEITLAGMETGFEELVKPKPWDFNVVFSYTEENVGLCYESAAAIAEESLELNMI